MIMGEGQFADPGQRAYTPIILDLPEPITALRFVPSYLSHALTYCLSATPETTYSAGRKHLIALDAKHQVWLFVSWGRPARIVSPVISDASSAVSRVIQVEAGWSNFAVLTALGTVYVGWPFEGEMKAKIDAHDQELDSAPIRRAAARVSEDRKVPCEVWDLHHDLFELPSIPRDLPTLGANTDSTNEEELRLIKIAAGDQFIVGLTNGGHVLKIDIQIDDQDFENGLRAIRQSFRYGERKWEYVSLCQCCLSS